jgi:hypothetical protein
MTKTVLTFADFLPILIKYDNPIKLAEVWVEVFGRKDQNVVVAKEKESGYNVILRGFPCDTVLVTREKPLC